MVTARLPRRRPGATRCPSAVASITSTGGHLLPIRGSPVLAQPVTDPRSWSAASVDACAAWFSPLSVACLAALNAAARDTDQESGPVTDAHLPGPLLDVCRNELAPVVSTLERGR